MKLSTDRHQAREVAIGLFLLFLAFAAGYFVGMAVTVGILRP